MHARRKTDAMPGMVKEGVEALAYVARARARGSAKRAGTELGYVLPEQPKSLAPDEVLIAVVDGNAVTVRTMKKPAGLRRDAKSAVAVAKDLARRLAEIDAVVNEVLGTETAAASSESASPLTEDEERVLRAGGFDTSPLRQGEDEPILRTALEYAHLLQSSFTVDEAAAALGVNTSRIRQRLGGDPRTLYGIKHGNTWRIPKFQFANKRLIPGIERVITRLPSDLHPVEVLHWFTTPNPDLEVDDGERTVSPVDWLRMGRSPEVAAELASTL